MVERFFAEITRKRIRRGVFQSVDELKQAIMDYLDNHNCHPKPYVWTKTAAEIFSKVARAKQALESQHYVVTGTMTRSFDRRVASSSGWIKISPIIPPARRKQPRIAYPLS